MISIVWTYSIIIAAPPLLGWRDAVPLPEDQCQITQHEGYTIYSTVGAFYLPLIVMVVMYARVFKATAKRTKHWVPVMPQRKEQKRKKKLTEVSVLISAPDSVRKYDDDSTGSSQPRIMENGNPIQDANGHQSNNQSRLSPHLGCKLSGYSSTHKSSMDSLNELEIEYNETMNNDKLNATQDGSGKNRQLIARVSSNATTDTNMSFEFSDSDVKLSGCYKTMCKDNTKKKDVPNKPRSNSTQSDNNFLGSDLTYKSPSSPTPKRKRSSCVMYQPEELNSNQRKVSSCVVYLDGGVTAMEPSPKDHHCSSRKSSCMIFREEEPELKDEDLMHLSESKRRKYAKKNRRQKWKISLSQEKRAAKTLGIIVGCFILCWLPFFMIALIKPLCRTCQFNTILTGIITWLGYLNSALNPIIYTFFNKDFRLAFKRILFCNPCKTRRY